MSTPARTGQQTETARGTMSRARPLTWASTNWAPLLVTCVGLVTAFFSLTAHGLWGDEVWSASWSQQQALPQTFTRFLTPPDLALNFMLIQMSTVFGQDDFWVRLPSACLGAATVPLLFLLGRRVYGTATGVAAAVILAAAPYHVWYTQDARPYAPLAFYALLSLYFLWTLLERPTAAGAAGFAAATALDLYNHLFGVFPLVIELAAVAVWGAVMWRRPAFSSAPPDGEPGNSRRARVQRARAIARRESARRRTVERSLAAVFGGALAALIVCLPLYSGIGQYILNSGPSEVPTSPFHMTTGFVVDLFSALGSGRWWPFWLLGALFLGGLAADAVHRAWFGALALAWLAVPLLVIWWAQPRHQVSIRYFLFLQPVFLLLVARGLVWCSHELTFRVPAPAAGPHRFRYAAPALTGMLIVGLALALFPPTLRSYSVERTNDWSALCSYVHAHARPGAVATGTLWAPAAWSWCFRQRTTDRADIAVSAPAAQTAGEVWYVLIGSPSPADTFDPRRYRAIPHAAWAPRGMDPAGSYGNRLPYPQSEIPGTLYYRSPGR